MSKVCEITKRHPQVGHTVSHANNKTKRRFLPNLHKRRIWVPSENRFVTMTLSVRGLRTIDKIGVEAALAKIKNKESIHERNRSWQKQDQEKKFNSVQPEKAKAAKQPVITKR